MQHSQNHERLSTSPFQSGQEISAFNSSDFSLGQYQSNLPPHKFYDIMHSSFSKSPTRLHDSPNNPSKFRDLGFYPAQVTPGPGSYNPRKRGKQSFNQYQCIGLTTARNNNWANDLSNPYNPPQRLKYPGVGSYIIDQGVRDEIERKRKTATNELVINPSAPFTSTSQRLCMKNLSAEIQPGPGSYSPRVKNKKISFSGQVLTGKAKFGRNEERFTGLFEPKEGPAPGQYERKVNVRKSRGDPIFTSTTSRFTNQQKAAKDSRIPQAQSPWQYSPTRSSTSQSPTPRKPTSPSRSFNTSSTRFSSREAIPGHQLKPTPGPGSYQFSSSRAPTTGFAYSQRFAYKSGQSIGPGAYNTESNFIKKTFNAKVESAGFNRPGRWG